jgi:hypothetical protein
MPTQTKNKNPIRFQSKIRYKAESPKNDGSTAF